ncbi:hypothetical protein, partial [Bacteroides hominis]|uniref:hypothetical protein n=1 Tax=Bacteroides hominis TaxID=2763023 RepID=UPI00345D15DF
SNTEYHRVIWSGTESYRAIRSKVSRSSTEYHRVEYHRVNLALLIIHTNNLSSSVSLCVPLW